MTGERELVTEDLHVVVLAAGKGTRMRSSMPKVLHRAGGLPLIEWVVRLARSMRPQSITVVLGHGASEVESWFGPSPGVTFVRQEPQLGTGHAVLQTRPHLQGRRGTLLLLSGDVPLLERPSLERLVACRKDTGAAVVVATAVVADPTGYGRVVRTGGQLTKIVEDRDATPEQRAVTEINSGVYAFSMASLFDGLQQIGAGNAQGEFYLPDLVQINQRAGKVVETVALENPDEFRGVNTRAELAEVGRLVQARTNRALMAAGVSMVDPATAYVGPDVMVGQDTVLHPFVILEGHTTIGMDCEVHAGVRIADSTIADGVSVFNHSVLVEATVEAGATIGPFARLRPLAVVGQGAHVGNFVEIKKSTVGAESKIGHLSYIGDASVGVGVNIGAGTITCNYDGHQKHRTVIGDKAFVGSDSTLVAPVTVGSGAYVAAGSAITEDVPPGSLGIARARQTVKPGWAADRTERHDSKDS